MKVSVLMSLKPMAQAVVVLQRKSLLYYLLTPVSSTSKHHLLTPLQYKSLFNASHRTEKPQPRDCPRALCYHGIGTH